VKDSFFGLVDGLCRELRANETLLCSLSAERSDFVRFNHSQVRQAGSVEQRFLLLRLVSDRRQASANVSLAGAGADLALCRDALARLRETVSQLPEDPWLLFAETPVSTSSERRGRLPAAEEVVRQVTAAARNVDFVGFYAAGTIYRGFANSLGQRNWHEVDSFNFDWSVYLAGDKAVKDGYAGFDWDGTAFEAKLGESRERLELMRTPPRTLAPAEYRTYLAPHALEEVTGLLQWNAFSARAKATHQSALLRMEHGEKLDTRVTIVENTEDGVAPGFQEEGFVKPPRVPLIVEGELRGSLVSARSAREYRLEANGAGAGESPESLDVAAGSLETRDILAALDTGLYVSNLWYLNFSDKPAGRLTGMTRFATFWVDNGKIVAPVTPLRFDDTLYRILGDNLVDLTRSRELLLSTSTYDERSTSSTRLPGALLRSLRFTL
jgi:predicted Zn-dependent protease